MIQLEVPRTFNPIAILVACLHLGVPPAAWNCRLGNRTALDRVIDQHKEKTPKDPTIRARFNTYRFADHKERVAHLLARVTQVSVETVAIVQAAPRPGGD